jgi:hypothetical protein
MGLTRDQSSDWQVLTLEIRERFRRADRAEQR